MPTNISERNDQKDKNVRVQYILSIAGCPLPAANRSYCVDFHPNSKISGANTSAESTHRPVTMTFNKNMIMKQKKANRRQHCDEKQQEQQL